MMPPDPQRVWFEQAQVDAERGVIECRMCRRRSGLEQTTTLWRNGLLVFALCDRCAARHEVVLAPTDAGIAIQARRVAALSLSLSR